MRRSGLSTKLLATIWKLVKNKEKGKYSQEEFWLLIKLIALAQADMPPALDRIADRVPVPTFGAKVLPQHPQQ